MVKFSRLFIAALISTSLLATPVYAAASASLLPVGATSVIVSSGNVANASAVATIPAVAGRLNYLLGFTVSGSGATVGLPVTVTITGLLGGTQSYTYTAATGATVGNAQLQSNYAIALPASAINTAIVITVPALGAGNTNSTVTAHGFYE